MSQRALNVVVDDLLTQPVQILVCEWYYGRPGWWSRHPSEWSRDLRDEAGGEVFRELAEDEPLEPGEAILTGVGRMRQYKGFIHVGARSIWGKSSEKTIREGVINAMTIVHQLGFASVAFPVLGAGRGLPERRAYEILRDSLLTLPSAVEVRIVRSPNRHG